VLLSPAGEKYGRLIPRDPILRAEVFNWVFWQMGGQGPFSGQFGHFFVYAPADKHEVRDGSGLRDKRKCVCGVGWPIGGAGARIAGCGDTVF
jgi:glutathione S-transferase